MSSIPTPPVVPPMSPLLRERLYGLFAWLSLVISAALVGAGTLAGFEIDVPRLVLALLGTSQAVVGAVWGWLGFVAKSHVTGNA